MEFRGRPIIELEEAVVFRAKNNKNPQNVKCTPPEDGETGKLFTGQGKDGYFESLSDEDKKSIPYLITPQTVVALTDGKVLRPGNQADKDNWRWLQLHPYIVLDREQLGSSRTAVFYIENRKAEAAKRVRASKERDKARYQIQFETSHAQQVSVAKTIGHPGPESFSHDELTDYLLAQCEVIPAAILKALSPENAEDSAVTRTMHELIKWGIIKKEKGGVYRFGGENGVFVGHNDEKIVGFLRDDKNKETVAAILAQLDSKKMAVAVSPQTV